MNKVQVGGSITVAGVFILILASLVPTLYASDYRAILNDPQFADFELIFIEEFAGRDRMQLLARSDDPTIEWVRYDFEDDRMKIYFGSRLIDEIYWQVFQGSTGVFWNTKQPLKLEYSSEEAKVIFNITYYFDPLHTRPAGTMIREVRIFPDTSKELITWIPVDPDIKFGLRNFHKTKITEQGANLKGESKLIADRYEIDWRKSQHLISGATLFNNGKLRLTHKTASGIQVIDPEINVGSYVLDVELVENTNECLVDCKLVLDITPNKNVRFNSTNPIKTFFEKASGSDNINVISVEIFEVEVVNETIVKNTFAVQESCVNTITKGINSTQVTKCTKNLVKDGIVSENKTVSSLTKMNKNNFLATADRTFRLVIEGKRTAGIGQKSIDIIPEIGWAKLREFAWWNSSWTYRKPITITNNNATDPLEFGVVINVSWDMNTEVGAGKAQADGDDFMIIYNDTVELDRLNESEMNVVGTNTTWSFKLQKNISAGASDNSSYFIYYGNTGATAPPVNGSNIYHVFNNFSDDIEGWHVCANGANGNVTHTGEALKISAASSFSGHVIACPPLYQNETLPENFFAIFDFNLSLTPTTISQGHFVYEWNNATVSNFIDDGYTAFDTPATGIQEFRLRGWNNGNNDGDLDNSASTITSNRWYRMRVTDFWNRTQAKSWTRGETEHSNYNLTINKSSPGDPGDYFGWAVFQEELNIDNLKIGRYMEPIPSVGLGTEEDNITVSNVTGNITFSNESVDPPTIQQTGMNSTFNITINSTSGTGLDSAIFSWNNTYNTTFNLITSSLENGTEVFNFSAEDANSTTCTSGDSCYARNDTTLVFSLRKDSLISTANVTLEGHLGWFSRSMDSSRIASDAHGIGQGFQLASYVNKTMLWILGFEKNSITYDIEKDNETNRNIAVTVPRAIDIFNDTYGWGGGPTAGNNERVWFWDGSNWNEENRDIVPGSTNINSLVVVNGSLVFLFADNGEIIKCYHDRASCTRELNITGNSGVMYDAEAFNDTLAISVGSGAYVFYGDGNNWSVLEDPFGAGLYGVDFQNGSGAWVVGRHGYVGVWNGGNISNYTAQSFSSDYVFTDVEFVNQSLGYISGYNESANSSPIILQWDGTTWNDVTQTINYPVNNYGAGGNRTRPISRIFYDTSDEKLIIVEKQDREDLTNTRGWVRIYPSSPELITIDIEEDGVVDVSIVDPLNNTNSPTERSLNITAVQDTLNNCVADSNGFCNVSIRFISKAGILTLSDFEFIPSEVNISHSRLMNESGNFTYYWWANDTSGNVNQTQDFDYEVVFVNISTIVMSDDNNFTLNSSSGIITFNQTDENTTLVTWDNATPVNQTDSIGIFNVTNNESQVAINITVKVNETLPACMTFKIGNVSTKINSTVLTTTAFTIYHALGINQSFLAWAFVDLFNCAPGLSYNGSVTFEGVL